MSEELIIKILAATAWIFIIYKLKFIKKIKSVIHFRRIHPKQAGNMDSKINLYNLLANKLLSSRAQNDQRIFNIAQINLQAGQTVEESVMTSCLFDIALQANDATEAKDIFAGMEIFKATVELLDFFKKWKDENLVSTRLWEISTDLIFKVSSIDKNQKEAIDFVLSELNHLENQEDDENQIDDNCYMELAAEIAAILSRQFFDINKHLKTSNAKLNDIFSLSYILGFSDWYIQDWYRLRNEKIKSRASAHDFSTLQIIFLKLYGTEKGLILFEKMFKSINENNSDAIKGRKIGNNDYVIMKNDKILPEALFLYCKNEI